MAISTRWYLPALATGFFLSSQAAAPACSLSRRAWQARQRLSGGGPYPSSE
jgi:hypothetical protein